MPMAGEKFYTVVVEGQGDKEVSEDELNNGSLVLVTHELDNQPKQWRRGAAGINICDSFSSFSACGDIRPLPPHT
jgi:hypothetical protein